LYHQKDIVPTVTISPVASYTPLLNGECCNKRRRQKANWMAQHQTNSGHRVDGGFLNPFGRGQKVVIKTSFTLLPSAICHLPFFIKGSKDEIIFPISLN
jgi:hypothetical protein